MAVLDVYRKFVDGFKADVAACVAYCCFRLSATPTNSSGRFVFHNANNVAIK